MSWFQSGGFYSAEDADSLPDFSSVKKREGAYYVWTEKEIDEILSNKLINGIGGLTYAEVFKRYYDIKSNGNVPPYEVRIQLFSVFFLCISWYYYICLKHKIYNWNRNDEAYS